MKNVVVFCDGTSNGISSTPSNVLLLFRSCVQNDSQVAFYDPGVGNLPRKSRWHRLRRETQSAFEMATGLGLGIRIKRAYRFICEEFEPGDKILLFGFSRGAYCARAVAGLIKALGLLPPTSLHLVDFAYSAYLAVELGDNWTGVRAFRKNIKSRQVDVNFLGLWDTVASVFAPSGRLLAPLTFSYLPYTANNDKVACIRHALSLDERRRLFSPRHWGSDCEFRSVNPAAGVIPQDVLEVWFPGGHGDVGGGFPILDSGLGLTTLEWMASEAKAKGLILDQASLSTIYGRIRRESWSLAPDHDATKHLGWRLSNLMPDMRGIEKNTVRKVPNGAFVSKAVIERKSSPKIQYDPVNLPSDHKVI